MGTKPSILIVDDDPKLRKTLSDILRARGYAPRGAATGEAALDRIQEERPAVVLIDLQLEDMSGLQVMGQIKERSPGTECVVLTGYASQASAIEAVNLGAYGYVQKPYDVEQLLVTIHRAIEKREAEEERERLILELQEALARVKTLSGLLPICASCKKIRDDKGYWHQVEVYVRDHSEAEFTHGLCPDCLKKLYPQYFADD